MTLLTFDKKIKAGTYEINGVIVEVKGDLPEGEHELSDKVLCDFPQKGGDEEALNEAASLYLQFQALQGKDLELGAGKVDELLRITAYGVRKTQKVVLRYRIGRRFYAEEFSKKEYMDL